MLNCVAILNDTSDQIATIALWQTLNVEVNTYRVRGQGESTENVGFLSRIANACNAWKRRLDRMCLFFLFPSRPKRVCQLRNGEDAPFFMTANLFFADAPQETNMIFLQRLFMASLPKLADPAVIFQDEL